MAEVTVIAGFAALFAAGFVTWYTTWRRRAGSRLEGIPVESRSRVRVVRPDDRWDPDR